MGYPASESAASLCHSVACASLTSQRQRTETRQRTALCNHIAHSVCSCIGIDLDLDRITYRIAAPRTRHGFQAAQDDRSADDDLALQAYRETLPEGLKAHPANVARQQVMTRGVIGDYVPHLPQNKESGALVARVAH